MCRTPARDVPGFYTEDDGRLEALKTPKRVEPLEDKGFASIFG